MANRSTLEMAAALSLLVVAAMAVVDAILTTALTGADVGPSEAASRCRDDSLTLVEGATTKAAAEAAGMQPNAVSNALGRYRNAHRKLLVAYSSA